MSTRALGRLIEHDPRSLNYPAKTDAVVSRSWYHYGPVLDQGQEPSCVGNAVAQGCNSKPLREGKPLLTETDAYSLYLTATGLDNIPGKAPQQEGTSGLAGAKAAQQIGRIGAYSHAFGFDHALGALMLGPLFVGMEWFTGMDQPDSRGYVEPVGAVRGGHEVLLLGVSVTYKRLKFLNSWSSDWGKGGFFYMSFDAFQRQLANGGDVVAPRPA